MGIPTTGRRFMKLRHKIKQARTAGLRALEVGRDIPSDAATFERLAAVSAAWLRANPDQARHVGLPCNEDAAALAALLDVLAVEIRHLDAAVRRQVVESCRIALGETATDTARLPDRRG